MLQQRALRKSPFVSLWGLTLFVFFLYGIWSEALNEPVINTVFSNSGRYIRLGYKYAV